MATRGLTAKGIKDRLRDAGLHVDRFIVRQDGTFGVSKAYFYRSGRTAGALAGDVKAAADRADLDCVILEVEDRWRAWPKTSYFWVRFRISEPEVMTRGGFLPMSEAEER